MAKINYRKIAIICLIVNVLYTFTMYSINGGFVPLLFRPNIRKQIQDDTFLKRRLYGIEFWVSFIGIFVFVLMMSYE